MSKVFVDILIIAGVIAAYIILGAMQPLFNDVITTGNLSANWTGMESGQDAYNAMPLIVWFIPGIVGIVALVVNHKMRGG